MITIPQATEKIIKRSRYLSEAMAKDLINASSLARYIQAEVEELVFKEVTLSSIVMAIKRQRGKFKSNFQSVTIFDEPPDMVVRSNLTLFYIKNSPTLLSKLSTVEKTSAGFQKKALFTYGRVETSILANKVTSESLQKILEGESIVLCMTNVSVITIHLPEKAVTSPGIFYFFIKSLAWEGVNILDMLSTQTELSLIFEQKDIHTAFGILQSLFTKD